MPLLNMKKAPKSRQAPPIDLLADVFRTGQDFYKRGLLTLVNGRRRMKGLRPLDWPKVGASPCRIRWQEGSLRLLQYDAVASGRGAAAPRSDAAAQKRPLLLVSSLINRAYILDLMKGRSVVERLLEAGREVWLLDWGEPGPADDERPLSGWALDLLPRAAREVARLAGTDSVHVLGYCMGGTLALMGMHAGALPAASLVAMATPVDFAEGGILSMWCRAPGFDAAEIVKVYGHAPPHLLQPAFKMLDPVGLATKLLHLEEKIDDDEFVRFFLAMEKWLEDSVPFPGRAFADWVKLYRDNALDLSSVRQPILSLVAKDDYITPPASAIAVERKAPKARHERIEWPGGHIGLATSGGAQKRLWPQVAAWLDARDVELDRARNEKLTHMQQGVVRSQKNVMQPHKKGQGKQR
jgi:polyhydroxyalkanoate synthase